MCSSTAVKYELIPFVQLHPDPHNKLLLVVTGQPHCRQTGLTAC